MAACAAAAAAAALVKRSRRSGQSTRRAPPASTPLSRPRGSGRRARCPADGALGAVASRPQPAGRPPSAVLAPRSRVRQPLASSQMRGCGIAAALVGGPEAPALSQRCVQEDRAPAGRAGPRPGRPATLMARLAAPRKAKTKFGTTPRFMLVVLAQRPGLLTPSGAAPALPQPRKCTLSAHASDAAAEPAHLSTRTLSRRCLSAPREGCTGPCRHVPRPP